MEDDSLVANAPSLTREEKLALYLAKKGTKKGTKGAWLRTPKVAKKAMSYVYTPSKVRKEALTPKQEPAGKPAPQPDTGKRLSAIRSRARQLKRDSLLSAPTSPAKHMRNVLREHGSDPDTPCDDAAPASPAAPQHDSEPSAPPTRVRLSFGAAAFGSVDSPQARIPDVGYHFSPRSAALSTEEHTGVAEAQPSKEQEQDRRKALQEWLAKKGRTPRSTKPYSATASAFSGQQCDTPRSYIDASSRASIHHHGTPMPGRSQSRRTPRRASKLRDPPQHRHPASHELEQALKAVKAGQPHEADAIYRDLEQRCPDVRSMAAYWVARANAEAERGDYDAAIEAFDTAVRERAQPKEDIQLHLYLLMLRMQRSASEQGIELEVPERARHRAQPAAEVSGEEVSDAAQCESPVTTVSNQGSAIAMDDPAESSVSPDEMRLIRQCCDQVASFLLRSFLNHALGPLDAKHSSESKLPWDNMYASMLRNWRHQVRHEREQQQPQQSQSHQHPPPHDQEVCSPNASGDGEDDWAVPSGPTLTPLEVARMRRETDGIQPRILTPKRRLLMAPKSPNRASMGRSLTDVHSDVNPADYDAESAPLGTIVVLEARRATRKEREELGADRVVTPVRRSTRHMAALAHNRMQRLNALLAMMEFVPNDAIPSGSLPPQADARLRPQPASPVHQRDADGFAVPVAPLFRARCYTPSRRLQSHVPRALGSPGVLDDAEVEEEDDDQGHPSSRFMLSQALDASDEDDAEEGCGDSSVGKEEASE